MADKYIRAGAAGTGSGDDWTNAYASLAAVTWTRGNTYYVADGAYTGNNFSTATSGTTTITMKKATASDHGTETGWGSTYGDGVATFSSAWTLSTAYHVLDGITGGGPGSWNSGFGFEISSTSSTGIIQVAAPQNIVRHVKLIGASSESTNDAIYTSNLAGDNTFTLSYAWIETCGRCPVFLDGHDSTAATGEQIFEYVYVEDYHAGASIHGEILSASQGNVPDVTFRYCLFEQVQSTGGIMWDNASDHNKRCNLYGNVFYRPSAVSWTAPNGVIGGWTGGGGEDCYNMRVYHNTFINVNVKVFFNAFTRAGDLLAGNNLFYDVSGQIEYNYFDSDYSHYINSGGTNGETNGTSAVSGDPFEDYVNRDFRVTANTTAGATLASTYETDMYGNTRTTWTRGAVEYASADTTPPAVPTGLYIT